MRENQASIGLNSLNYSLMSENAQSFYDMTEEIFVSLDSVASSTPWEIENKDFLLQTNEELEEKSSYLLVRKENEIYFTGNQTAGELIFERLPEYGSDSSELKIGFYISDMQKMVKQIDFQFADGSKGSLFIITKINSIVSKQLLVDMFFAIVLILLFTGYFLTRWIQRGIFAPIAELNIAMESIAQGRLDYSITTNEKGELGTLYRNYEDMRMRLKESADEELENDRKNRELISNISHDLKTPITSIKGYVEGIQDGVADTPEKMEKYLKTIYNKANDMDRLINELTIYSGIDSNRIPYNFHRINVAEYFGDCIDEVGLDLESKNIVLNYSNLVSQDTIIIADPEQMKRVINNIIGNSVKYMDKEKGIIDIRILDEMDSIRVEIEDNGKGVGTKDLANIFERFYRTDASRNSSQGGSGIGLSIVKKIIEDHGGYIWATSREGEGTCLHFVVRKYKELE